MNGYDSYLESHNKKYPEPEYQILEIEPVEYLKTIVPDINFKYGKILHAKLMANTNPAYMSKDGKTVYEIMELEMGCFLKIYKVDAEQWETYQHPMPLWIYLAG